MQPHRLGMLSVTSGLLQDSELAITYYLHSIPCLSSIDLGVQIRTSTVRALDGTCGGS